MHCCCHGVCIACFGCSGREHCNPFILQVSPWPADYRSGPVHDPAVWASICLEALALHYLCSPASSLNSSLGSATTVHHGSPAGSTVALNDADRSVRVKCATLSSMCGSHSPSNWLVPAGRLFLWSLLTMLQTRWVLLDGWWVFILQLHRHDRMPQLLEVRREGGRTGNGGRGGGRENTWHYWSLDWFSHSEHSLGVVSSVKKWKSLLWEKQVH